MCSAHRREALRTDALHRGCAHRDDASLTRVEAGLRSPATIGATGSCVCTEAWLAPLAAAAEAQAQEAGPRDVETALHALSCDVLAHAQIPGAAMLTRCLAAQAMQFPELAKLAHEEGWLRGVRAVSQLLAHFAAEGQITVEDPELAADLFLNLVLGRASRLALYGIETDAHAAEQRRKVAVALFLNGVR